MSFEKAVEAKPIGSRYEPPYLLMRIIKMRDVSRALLAIRKFHGIKQGELSEALSVSSSYLCEIEKGRKNVNLELLKKYSDYFDIPISSILFLSERMESDTGLAGSFRVKAAGLILKMLEWSATKEENNE